MTTPHPLAALRRQGLDADLHKGRVRVWPRHKVKKALALFVTFHLEDIAQALVVESNEKFIENVFLWDLPAPVDVEDSKPATGEIPKHLDGKRFAGIPAPAL